MGSARAFKVAGWRETTVLLVVAWFVPFAIHLVPWAGERPLGAYLLPMFWTALIAMYFFGVVTGVITALVAPVINLAVTGLPALRGVGFASFELVVFVGVVAWFVRRWPRFVLIAPLAYILARLASAGLQVALGDQAVSVTSLQHSFGRATAGLVVLAAINAGLVWFFPKTPSAAS